MEVVIRKSEVCGCASPPPSKSYTHRAFIISSLSRKSKLENCLISDDTLATLSACRKIGAEFVRRKEITFWGVDEIHASGYFYMANSGTTLRLFLGLLALSKSGKYSLLDGDESLRKRPNFQLVSALKSLGAEFRGYSDFKPPIWVKGLVKGGRVELEAPSSQFLSSLLISLPLAKGDSEVRVYNLKSRPYVNITIDVLSMSGIKLSIENNSFYIKGGQRYNLRRFRVPADFTSASYLIAAGLLAGKVIIKDVFESEQGDRKIIEICKEMGGSIRWNKEKGEIYVEMSELEGVEIDASDIPDLVPTIAILGAVAKGKTKIENAEHLRIKEIDRLKGIYTNLKSLGVEVKQLEDGLVIYGGKKEFKGTVNSFGDHRMALAFSLLGLLGEVRIINAEVVSVSFPNYFDVLKSLGALIFQE